MLRLITKPQYRINVRTLCLMVGCNPNAMEPLKQALKPLAEAVGEWDVLDAKGKQEWGVSSLFDGRGWGCLL